MTAISKTTIKMDFLFLFFLSKIISLYNREQCAIQLLFCPYEGSTEIPLEQNRWSEVSIRCHYTGKWRNRYCVLLREPVETVTWIPSRPTVCRRICYCCSLATNAILQRHCEWRVKYLLLSLVSKVWLEILIKVNVLLAFWKHSNDEARLWSWVRCCFGQRKSQTTK